MTYAIATAARIHLSDGTVRDASEPDVQMLYLAHGVMIRRGKTLRNLGGRNLFERTLQRTIIDWLGAHEKPGRPRVLIIGDSIRMRISDATGYGLHAYRRLVDHVNLTHIPHNTGGTISVLKSIEDWLLCKPDVVHVNAGLHDLALDSTIRAPLAYATPETYRANLQQIISILEGSGVKTIIWGNSAPVHDEWHSDADLIRRLRDVQRYNDVADEVMKSRGISTNDLFQPTSDTGLERSLLRDGVHLSDHGAALLGQIVADRILQACGGHAAKIA